MAVHRVLLASRIPMAELRALVREASSVSRRISSLVDRASRTWDRGAGDGL